jgi:hypothetical protein
MANRRKNLSFRTSDNNFYVHHFSKKVDFFFLYGTCWITKFSAGIQIFLKNFLLKFSLFLGLSAGAEFGGAAIYFAEFRHRFYSALGL